METLSMDSQDIIDRLVKLANKSGTAKKEAPVTVKEESNDTESMIAKLVRLAGHANLLHTKQADKQEDKLVGVDPVQVLRETIAQYEEEVRT